MPKDFFTDNSMKSCLLDGMLRVLKQALALEMFWPKLWIFKEFLLLGERGGSWLRLLVSTNISYKERLMSVNLLRVC